MHKQEELRNQIRHLVRKYSRIKYADSHFIQGKTVIPVAGKVIDGDETELMVDAALDGWLTTGRFNAEFERRLAEFIGIKHVLTVNSGSSANLVAFSTLTSRKLGKKAIKPGDEVITVAAGFPTTINPAIQYGAIPVFVDINTNTYNIDSKLIEDAISAKTKAIILAHTLGNPFDVDVVKDLCDKYDLWLIEDCCDALGAKFKGKLVGNFGDMATLSFYPAHHITMGEGGAVLTNSTKLKRISESIRDWGRDCFCQPGNDDTCGKRFSWSKSETGGSLPDKYDHKYIYSHLGYNLKITDMQAACGLGQLKKLSAFIKTRDLNFAYLDRQLKSLECYFILPKPQQNSEPSWFGYPLTLRDQYTGSRHIILEHLNKSLIQTRLLFAGNLVRQPYMEKISYKISGTLDITEKVMENTFWIGLFPGLNADHLKHTCNCIKDATKLIKTKN